MRAEAVVQQVRGERAIVRLTGIQGGCGRCSEPGGCGGVSLADPFRRLPTQFEVDNPIGAACGETVHVEVPPGVPMRAAGWVYGLPLLLALGGAAVVAQLAPAADQDLYVLAAVAAGLVLGLLAMRKVGERSLAHLRPRLVRPTGPGCQSVRTAGGCGGGCS